MAQDSSKTVENFNVPWEESYGYGQAVRAGNTIYVAGQLAHDRSGKLIAPATLDSRGGVTDFSNMEAQMRAAYANVKLLLERFGATMDDVVEETLYVLDVDAAFLVAGAVRKEAFGRQHPKCASTLVGTPRLAFREQLMEVSVTAVLSG